MIAHAFSNRIPSRLRMACMLIVVLLPTAVFDARAADDDSERWVASWYTAQADHLEGLPPTYPAAAPKTLSDQTLRQIVYVSAGGRQVRLKLSNLFGAAPVTFDAVTIAANADSGARIDAEGVHAVTFHGATSVTVEPGKDITSDAVDFSPRANSSAAISIYLKQPTPIRTVHNLALQRNFVAPGDATRTAAPAWSEINDNPNATDPGGFTAWITELDVLREDKPILVVGFGDSITDGFGSTIETNRRWPNILSRLLAAASSRVGPSSVVDAGVSGNRWKTDWQAPKGEARFGRDVLEVSGVTHVVILLGINDIGYDKWVPRQIQEAADITAALQTAVDEAKARGLKVFVGTLTPFRATPIYYSDARDAKRRQVNEFIRGRLTGADAIVDFDQALRNPARPLEMLPAYDSGDHLHPNDRGYEVMAETIATALRKP